ncbi:uncharacterized protein LOC132754438 [Ruditapes philippinarum]|uniref:uncharacterized protein LOC132754438 n=1 Tax=Ruditapes philippinarum TaxID=129788 RepID=UPI00295BAF8D|nr:uncharacterized protein LOC132754438 [Ruditapes philippinarum]
MTPPLKPERMDLSGADNYLMAILKPPINNIDIDSFPNNVCFKNPKLQQERSVLETLPRVFKDQPLLAPDKRQDKDFGHEPIPSGDLDWNKVFTFLVNIIEPSTWKLFFVELFGMFSTEQELILEQDIRTNKLIRLSDS